MNDQNCELSDKDLEVVCAGKARPSQPNFVVNNGTRSSGYGNKRTPAQAPPVRSSGGSCANGVCT